MSLIQHILKDSVSTFFFSDLQSCPLRVIYSGKTKFNKILNSHLSQYNFSEVTEYSYNKWKKNQTCFVWQQRKKSIIANIRTGVSKWWTSNNQIYSKPIRFHAIFLTPYANKIASCCQSMVFRLQFYGERMDGIPLEK